MVLHAFSKGGVMIVSIIIGYLFVGSVLGKLFHNYFLHTKKFDDEDDRDVVAVVSGTFWPFAVIIFIGISVAKVIIAYTKR
jgi:hypothetical protein